MNTELAQKLKKSSLVRVVFNMDEDDYRVIELEAARGRRNIAQQLRYMMEPPIRTAREDRKREEEAYCGR